VDDYQHSYNGGTVSTTGINPFVHPTTHQQALASVGAQHVIIELGYEEKQLLRDLIQALIVYEPKPKPRKPKPKKRK
jgi:hypothetical protein